MNQRIKAPETPSTSQTSPSHQPISLLNWRMQNTDERPSEEWNDLPFQTEIRQSRIKNSPSGIFLDSPLRPYYVINIPIFIDRNMIRSMKRDLSEIVNYVIDECLMNIKKKSKWKGAKMVELQYFETGCKENCILRKTTGKFIILIFEIFGIKFILKHYTHRKEELEEYFGPPCMNLRSILLEESSPSYTVDIFSCL